MVALTKKQTSHHTKALATSAKLTGWFRDMYRPGALMPSPKKVIRVLNEAKVRFVLMGTHGVGGYRSQARATQDVDVLIAARDHAKAVRAVQEAFPKLLVLDTPVVTRFKEKATGEPRIDLMKPNQPLFRVAFRHTVKVGETHQIPDLEFALVSKFAAMVSHYRDADKKMIDGGDFINIVKHNRADIELKKLVQLAERVYVGGGKEIRAMIDSVDAGKTIQV